MGKVAKKRIGNTDSSNTSDEIITYSYGIHDIILTKKYPDIVFQKIFVQSVAQNDESGHNELRRFPVLIVADTYDSSAGEKLEGPYGYHYSITTSYSDNPSLGAMIDSTVQETAAKFMDDNFEAPEKEKNLIEVPNLIVDPEGSGWKAPK